MSHLLITLSTPKIPPESFTRLAPRLASLAALARLARLSALARLAFSTAVVILSPPGSAGHESGIVGSIVLKWLASPTPRVSSAAAASPAPPIITSSNAAAIHTLPGSAGHVSGIVGAISLVMRLDI